MLQLRPYQEQAVEAVFSYWAEEPGNPLVDLATGLGKSLCLAELVKRLVGDWQLRVLVVTHVAELIEQSYKELLGVWAFAPAGVYSAGLGQRDSSSQILFCGIQTVWNKVNEIGHVDVILVDEAHLIPKSSATMYGKFIDSLRGANPDLKILGLTATPFRLDSGRLDEGDDKLFDRVVYEYGVGDGIADGYLAPLSSKPTATTFDMDGVRRQGGDYRQNELQAAVDKEEVTRAAVAEIVAKGQDRRSWLVFCSGVDHALHVRDEIRTYGITCETVTGSTPKGERRAILEAYKNYEIRALTNNSVLTTGFNHKGVDLIAALRPTLSASLYLQMMGRGTRPIYKAGMPLDTVEERLAAIAAGPKPNCLVLDFAGLVSRHGPVDRVEPKRPGEGKGEAPIKQCPQCEELLHISLMVCSCCGHEFPPSEDVKITATAEVSPILSTEEPWIEVTGRTFSEHLSKNGNVSVVVDFVAGRRKFKEWLGPGAEGVFMRGKADRFWNAHGGERPFPKSVGEFLERAGELKNTAGVRVKVSASFKGKFDITNWQAGDADYVSEAICLEPANDNAPKGNLARILGKSRAVAGADDVAARERVRQQAQAFLEDEIPF